MCTKKHIPSTHVALATDTWGFLVYTHLLCHCVTWQSESERGFMKMYWQWENVRVYRGIAFVCVYTTSMASSAYLWSTPPVREYPTCVCLPHFDVSTPPLHVYHMHMSTLHPRVYSTSTYLLHIHMSTPHQHVYSTSTCLLYIHVSTPHPSLRVYPSFTFENENTFALAPTQRLLYSWAWELLQINRTFGVWIFFFSVIVLHENQKAKEDSWKFIDSGKTYESTVV